MSQLALSTGRAPLAGGGQFTDLSFPLKMFNLLLVFLPALACIARDPNEGKEKVHSFEVKYNVSRQHLEQLLILLLVPHQRAKRREKRKILPENFLPGVPYFERKRLNSQLVVIISWVSSYMSSSITEMQR